MSGNAIVLYVGNTNILEVTLTDALTDAAINSATVTVTLTDIAGNALAGDTWPKTLAYVSASEGLYRGYVASTVELSEGTHYLYEATATKDGMTANWGGDVSAQQRSF